MTTFLFGILIARGTNENIDLGHKPIVIWPKKPKPKVELSVSEKTSFFQNGRVSIKYIFLGMSYCTILCSLQTVIVKH